MSSAPIPDISGILTKMLSDPEMLQKAVSMASVLRESGIGSILSGGQNPGEDSRDGTGSDNDPRSRSDGDAEEKPDDPSHNDFNEYSKDKNDKYERKDNGKYTEEERNDLFADSRRMSERKALITAIKPYLSEKRREKADILILLLTLLDALSHNNGGKDVQP